MIMEKKQTIFRVGAILLVLCMVSTVMLSGTYAKYTSEYAGQDTALVARWDFTVTDGTTALGANSETLQDLDLLSHAYVTHMNQKDGEKYILAPGVSDEFTLKMNFLSDVDAKVTIDLDEAGTVDGTLPIEFQVSGSAVWVNSADALEAELAKAFNASAVGNTFTFDKSLANASAATVLSKDVKWRWAFQQSDITTGDAIDTALGKASATANRTDYILRATIKAEQIAPTEI